MTKITFLYHEENIDICNGTKTSEQTYVIVQRYLLEKGYLPVDLQICDAAGMIGDRKEQYFSSLQRVIERLREDKSPYHHLKFSLPPEVPDFSEGSPQQGLIKKTIRRNLEPREIQEVLTVLAGK